MIKRNKKPLKPISRKRFFIECGAGCALYCMFAWGMLGYYSEKDAGDSIAASAQQLQQFTAVLAGSVICLIGLLVFAWFRGKKRLPDWDTKDAGILGMIGGGSILAGLGLLVIFAKLYQILK